MIKIAAATENGETLSSHFGRAPQYLVYSVEAGEISSVDTRQKPHHGEHAAHDHGQPHAHDHDHGDMFAPIQDCQVLLVGGMGQPAYQKALTAGLEVVLTGGAIEATVQAYLNGELASDLRRVHAPH